MYSREPHPPFNLSAAWRRIGVFVAEIADRFGSAKTFFTMPGFPPPRIGERILLARWLLAAECMLRRLLYIEACRVLETDPPPLRALPARAGRGGGRAARPNPSAHPEADLVTARFCLEPPAMYAQAEERSLPLPNHRAKPPAHAGLLRLARRMLAVQDALKDPAPYAHRLAARLMRHHNPHALARTLIMFAPDPDSSLKDMITPVSRAALALPLVLADTS